ncbi:MAG: sensor histidine kinase [Thiobacillus sp.]
MREGVALLGDELAGSLNPRQRAIVTIMDTGSRELQQRIEDLIRYGNIQDARPPAAPVAVGEALASVFERQRLALEARRIAVETELAAPAVLADRALLETVLDNLLSNAVKFSPDGGRILVRSDVADDAVVLWFCDEGEGIPEALRSRVFEPFFQGPSQPESPVKGSGLGLSIVRESVLAAGGTIGIVDAPPWSTCFRLSLPLPP